MKNPKVFVDNTGSETVLKFQFGFYSFKSVQEIFPECRYLPTWRSFDGDQYLQVAIPSSVAMRHGIEHHHTFSLLASK
jgi:hypothetical protein